jgi:ubiquitin carboxyl-terminal hydrolase 25
LREKTIYSALHDELDRSDIIDEGTKVNGLLPNGIKVRRTYNSIRNPPPVLQVHCKRVDFDKKTGKAVRSDRALRLDDVIYLDRFLEEPKSISPKALFERRVQFWQWQQQLNVLQSRQTELSDSGISLGPEGNLDLAGATEQAARFLHELKDPSADQSEDDQPGNFNNLIDGLPEALIEQVERLRAEKTAIESKIADIQAQMDTHFDDLKSAPYRLHSIFIHRGGVTGGHYFVYIHDFKDDTWRQYNDEHVSEAEEEQLAKAMGLVGSSESSTNIVYVRDDLKGLLTEAVCRHIVRADSSSDVRMDDMDVIDGIEVK